MIVSLRDAAFSYGQAPILSAISAQVNAGEGMALIGPNGCGKTTLLRGIVGTAQLCGGTMEVHASRISYVPQVADIDRTFPVTAFDVVAMGVLSQLRFFQPLGAHAKRVHAALEKVGLGERAGTHFGSLSGGQQQRVLLARAIVAQPDLVLLDEPFNGLDTANRDILLVLLNELKAQGTALIASTHDYELAEGACDTVLALVDPPQFGPVNEVVPAYVD
ncbi:Zinc import ATP-binding protein ZnuC [Corynebacterium ciconiae DSM 44920]|uniref:metal ABC transporter ATP-binding protein n=1 Tax=Corynebacterium ciconiae TaxID=227319 RepID=UPI0003757C17|nr:ABC transporter ATP-binding protein [Corynebacterium ciconiae]WKD62010.1 Zinc import ATP-binding protein ZnuC [Corynebacterium ciconiae DSM 44920]